MLDIQSIRSRLNQSTRELRKVQMNSADICKASYKDLLAICNADMATSTKSKSQRKAKFVNQAILSESTKDVYSRLKNIVKPSEFQALSKIEISRPDTQLEPTLPGQIHSALDRFAPDNSIWDTIIAKEDMEEHLLQFNKIALFKAASESPCGNNVIHDALTYKSLSEEAKDLLHGIVPVTWYGNDNLLKEFLSSFQIPESVLTKDLISTDISTADLTKGLSILEGIDDNFSLRPSSGSLQSHCPGLGITSLCETVYADCNYKRNSNSSMEQSSERDV